MYIKKKIVALSVAFALALGMATSAFADGANDPVQMKYAGNTSKVLNVSAATDADVKEGSRLTLYSPTSSNTQRFFSSNHAMFCAVRTDLCFTMNNADSSVILSKSRGSDNQYIDIINQAGSRHRIEFVRFGRVMGTYGTASNSRVYCKTTAQATVDDAWIY